MLRKLFTAFCLAGFVVSLSACGWFGSTTAQEIKKPQKDKVPAAQDIAEREQTVEFK